MKTSDLIFTPNLALSLQNNVNHKSGWNADDWKYNIAIIITVLCKL